MGSREAEATRAARDEGDLSCKRAHNVKLLSEPGAGGSGSQEFFLVPLPPNARRLQLRDHLLTEHPDRFQGLLVRGTARLAKADNEIIWLDLRLPPLQLCQTVLG